jgi:adenylyltransferase/sulfurtransferase
MASAGRYVRQTILREIGPEGQTKLSAASVGVIGLGALGTVSAGLLARAGVGRLRLIDRDVVELNNLQRQVLFDEKDVELPKADVAERKLRAVNSSIAIEGIAKDVHSGNIESLLEGVDLVVDGADNMELRFLLNEVSIARDLPWIYGGAIATHGMAMAIVPKTTACFRCFLPQMPAPGSLPTCDTAGILNTVSSIVGSLQATAAIQLLVGEPPAGELLVFDGWSGDLQRLRVSRRKDCPACVRGEREFLGARRGQVIAALCGGETISIDPAHRGEIDLAGVESRLRKLGAVKSLGSVLVFEADGARFTLFSDGRALIRGTDDPERARSLYAKYVGM